MALCRRAGLETARAGERGGGVCGTFPLELGCIHVCGGRRLDRDGEWRTAREGAADCSFRRNYFPLRHALARLDCRQEKAAGLPGAFIGGAIQDIARRATPPPPCAIRCQCDLLGWASTGVVGLSPRAGGVSRGTVAVICLTLVIGAMASLDAAQLWSAAAAKKCNTYNASRDELLVAVRASRTNFRGELYEYVRDHSAPDEGVFATNAVRPFRIRSIKPRWSSGLERRIGHCRVLTPRWRKGAPLGAPNWWDPPPRRCE